MKISSISLNENNNNLRRNMFIKYSNSFMSTLGGNDAIEKAQKINPTNKVDKSMGIETLTIFPKQVIDGQTIITA